MVSFYTKLYFILVSLLIVSNGIFTADSSGELATGEKYLFLEAIIRHGSRTAFSHLISDPVLYPLGEGELTATGMRQQYILGKLMQQKYHTFIDRQFMLNEIWVRSTGFDRTIQSGASFLEGMFERFSAFKIPFATTNNKLFPQWNNYKNEVTLGQVDYNTALPINFVSYPIWTPDQGKPDYFLKADDLFPPPCNATQPLRDEASKKFAEYIDNSWYMKAFNKYAFDKFKMHDPSLNLDLDKWSSTFMISDAIISEYENNPKLNINLNEAGDKFLIDAANTIYS